MPDVLDGLTTNQQEAVTHGDGPLLVVAGAGSGKTRVITRRVAWLAANGVRPYRILAITFTNKAADEMKRRVQELTGLRGAWVSTFHSMCARMLRQFQDLLGFTHPFTIYDRKDSLDCVKMALTELGLTDPRARPQSFLAAIGRWKNQMATATDALAAAQGPRDAEQARAYELYERTCRNNNALDFDDLLFRTAQLLKDNADFRAYWQNRFEQVLIDEYQDTNRPQYVIARLLTASHRNICATGDPDQSIYGWRGADIANILDFQKDYPDARVVKLEENFRSTKMILLAASGVIEHNRARIERGLWTHNDAGVPVEVVQSLTDVNEADAIVARIRESAGSVRYGEMAVFYRTHAQSRVIEESFRDAGVPYRILDAVEFYNRKEIKDVVAYLKATVNPADAVSLLRIINEPKRGIGAKTVERVRAFAASEGLSLDEVLPRAAEVPGLSARAAKGVTEFAALLDRLRGFPGAPVADVVRAVLTETGYLKRLSDSDSEEDAARADNVKELVSAAAEFDEAYPDQELSSFLEKVTLVSDSDAITEEGGQVMLMTLHSAKGLEFPIVFITGVEEGLLPHINALGSSSRIEEERRLCYVGMTRAKKRLYLHWAAERYVAGQVGMAMASRFIREIPAEAKREPGGRRPQRQFQGLLTPAIDREPSPRPAASDGDKERVIEYDEDLVEYEGVGLSVDDRVEHPRFGVGRVVSLSGRGATAKAVVDFGGRRRHLMLQFAKLVRLT